MKTKEEIEQLSETAFQDELIKSNQNINWIGYGKGIDGTSKERWIELWIKGYTQCQEDMYEFGKLVLDTFHSEGKTHSGKDRLPRVKFNEWFNSLKQD